MKNCLAQIGISFSYRSYLIENKWIIESAPRRVRWDCSVLVFQVFTVGHKKRVSALTQPLLTLNLIL